MLRTAAPVEASSRPEPKGLPCPGMLAALTIPHSALNIMERLGHDSVRNIRRNPHLANGFRQNPVDLSTHGLLVANQQAQDFLLFQAAKLGQWPHGPDQPDEALAIGGIKHARKFRQASDHQHSPRHSLAMQKSAISGGLFQGMAKGV